jgi:hypothetical protein
MMFVTTMRMLLPMPHAVIRVEWPGPVAKVAWPRLAFAGQE